VVSGRRVALALGLLLTLAACALPALLADAPWVPSLPLRPLALDALGAFFVLLALAGASLALARGASLLGVTTATLTLLLAYAAAALPLLALGLGGAALLGWWATAASAAALRERMSWRERLLGPLDGAPGPGWLLPPLLLLTAALLLRAAGSWRYDSPLAGAGLNAASFTLVLAAALLGMVQLTPRATVAPVVPLLLAPAWAYPLARLYSFGPWNSGWHAAALLLLGALALWSAIGALGARDPAACRGLLARSALASALLALCLGSSAGLAAAAFGLLSYLLVAAALVAPPSPALWEQGDGEARATFARWLLTPALPLSAPFVATWMLLGAAAASAAPAAIPVAWLSALLGGLVLALRPGLASAGWGLGALSLALGAGSPALTQLLIAPLVAQLQGGLSPFGELTVWPWLGLAMLDSRRSEIAVLPSLAVAGLLLVLVACIYLLVRLLGTGAAPHTAGDGGELPVAEEGDFWALLRRQVFWLDDGERP
jgi:hypothetical protein